ncbi:MAG: hypothetical protein CM1200mP39_29730 [Dehalococcoidia bacterium]|nr:MAG: hypothetical protein CM1200mP39_29730 [Dehalococcoidia bacterium]
MYWSSRDFGTRLPRSCPRLRYIQSIGAGYDQFPLATLKARSISLANATGVKADAVSHHAMGLILALYRELHTGRDNQKRKKPGAA